VKNDTRTASDIAFAHSRTPGQGLIGQALNKRWCFLCETVKPTLGSSQRGGFFVCADCSKPKGDAK
jgi:hypothetical protein